MILNLVDCMCRKSLFLEATEKVEGGRGETIFSLHIAEATKKPYTRIKVLYLRV